MQTDYTSLNNIRNLNVLEKGVIFDPTQYHDFYCNRDGVFAYQGEDAKNNRRPKFNPNVFFGRDDVKGAHPTPWDTVEVYSEGKKYILRFTDTGEFACKEVWHEVEPHVYLPVHVLRLPQDHPATLLFSVEEIVAHKPAFDPDTYGGCAA